MCKLNQRDALLGRATGDGEKVLTISLGESSVALSNIGGDGNIGSIELV